MINEGFFPKDIENEYAKVETCLEPLKENYLDKRIYGKFVIKKKLENMGVRFIRCKHTWQHCIAILISAGSQFIQMGQSKMVKIGHESVVPHDLQQAHLFEFFGGKFHREMG